VVDVDRFADHQRIGLHQELVGPEVGAPGFAEVADVAGVDFVLGREAGVVGVPAEQRPVFDFRRLDRVFASRDRAAAATAGRQRHRCRKHSERHKERFHPS